MKANRKNRGFSLAEVLLAIGVLAVGVLFVAGVFPVCVHLTTVVTEQTIAAITADEAFAKIKIYAKGNPAGGIDFSKLRTATELMDFNDVLMVGIDPCEFTYPSTGTDILQKQYYWTALCRGVDTNSPRLVQVTVFVSRKAGSGLSYPAPPVGSGTVDWPAPVKVGVTGTTGGNELTITGNKTFINDGYTIVDDKTGQIYRVLERYASADNTILLDRNWEGGSGTENIWVVPPPTGGGRGPCVGAYQKVIRF